VMPSSGTEPNRAVQLFKAPSSGGSCQSTVRLPGDRKRRGRMQWWVWKPFCWVEVPIESGRSEWGVKRLR
jgi:hypothetical protein